MELPIGILEFGLFDGYIYGLWTGNNTMTANLSKVVKISVENGTQKHFPTHNSNMLFNDNCKVVFPLMVCVGWKLYMTTEYGSHFITLDLRSMEWKKTELKVDGMIIWLKSDGKRTLIVTTEDIANDSKLCLYRFIVEQPDLLWNLASMATKRHSNLDSSYREYILSKLPKNSKFRCPLL
ncbi:hypothetical protein M3Y94_00884900 [Aphelenchoides besseyi]|nr:hypothetical protein M3Y94_00884900 [Aphelenchoides besseyi]